MQRKRRSMVASVRRGRPLREVARVFGVALSTVQAWVARAGRKRLDRVDWSDRPHDPQHSPHKSQPQLEERVLALRQQLKRSVLGEYGAAAIRHALQEEGVHPLPCERTVHRILQRNGALDANARRRARRLPPPAGWHVPEVLAQRQEMDELDIVSGLALEGGLEIETLNAVSVHGGLVDSFVAQSIGTRQVLEGLLWRWQQQGLPGYVQFDNDTRFLGPSNRPDILGWVPRVCLSLGVVPVFAPPRETGFQAAIESYNNLWQQKVWDARKHPCLQALVEYSQRYVAASHSRHAARADGAPLRRPFPDPADWQLSKERIQAPPNGLVLFIRRTDDHSCVSVLGHRFSVAEDRPWVHRLVRCEMHLDAGCIRFFGLRRADPANQPLLGQAAYQFPAKRFKATDLD